ncbi:MAG: HEAT repeat domain-containing protein [Alkalinema sp. RU_4_3]|nr:HEAT repeat domain-containing protein [Alkalinema sp. RU_4_3]
MNISEIQTHLESDNPQMRMRGLVALRSYGPEIAVPLLASRVHDGEIMVRSFVAMGLGFKQNPEAFNILVEMLKTEPDSNIQAEIASALSKYGHPSLPYVTAAFYENPHWIVRMSVLLALSEMNVPDRLFQLCLAAFVDSDPTVQETAIQCMASLAGTPYEEDTLLHLLAFAQSNKPSVRRQVAIALRRFTDLRAEEVLTQMLEDSDHRVVAAVLEGAFANQ